MNRLFLLSKDMKVQYRQDNYENDLTYIRIMLLLCVFFYSVFALMDLATAGEMLGVFLRIRFFYVNPFFIAVLLMSFHPSFNRLHQPAIFIAYIAAGMGISAMLILLPGNFSYYGGLFLIFAVGHFLTRMYWNYVSIASLIIVAAYLAGLLLHGDSLTQGLVYAFFYVQFIIICIYGSYTFERHRVEKFAQTHALMDDKVLLERENYDKLIDIEQSHRITIFSLAKLAESRDKYTGDHIERVGALCLKLAEGLPEEIYLRNGEVKANYLETIELASTLHDVGKVAIPESILMKPGRLTEEEMEVMKRHTAYGYENLMYIRERYEKNAFVNMGIDICRYHHERWDGTGYPDGLAGEDIPLSARIVAVVDVYDALISERPYKKAFGPEVTRSEIEKGVGSMFDPEIAGIFLSMID